MIRVLWVAALLLAAASTAKAQDIGAVLGTSAADAYAASTHGPVLTDVHLFSKLYDGLLNPIDNAVQVVVQDLVTYVTPLLKAIAVLLVTVGGIGYAIGGHTQEMLLGYMLRNWLRPAIVMQILASTAAVNQFVIAPLRAIPTDIGNALAGVGGAPLIGGAPFDGLFASLTFVKDTALQHTTGVIDAIGQMVLIAVTFLVGVVIVAVTFTIWLLVHAGLLVTLSLSPLMLCMAVFPATRGFFAGYLNQVATFIISLILCVVLLKISLTIQQQLLAPILAAPADAGMSGMTTALTQMVACQFVIAVLVAMANGIAGSICGGGVALFGSVGTVTGGIYKTGQLVGRLARRAAA